ncbi:hypothetical protein PT974_00874 [Cladobotryum mycophilum]|uniref:Uncharacterized protein n=1 Tax=Cladobotryum mycophilum TaxID=491253 RepID=A0ABR0T3B3_9HYPO
MPALPPLARPEGLSNPHVPVVCYPPTPSKDIDYVALLVRQYMTTTPTPTFVVIPETYGAIHTSLAPGIIVAIVLGSVIGFLLIIAGIYAALGFGGSAVSSTKKTTHEGPSAAGGAQGEDQEGSQGAGGEGRRARDGDGVGAHEDRREACFFFEEERGTAAAGESQVAHRGGAGAHKEDYDEENEVVVIEENTPPTRRKSRRGPAPYDEEDEVVVIEENTPRRERRAKRLPSDRAPLGGSSAPQETESTQETGLAGTRPQEKR